MYRIFRRTRLSTALRMRFKGSGLCREEKPFGVEKLTSDFASARSVLFAGSVLLMISVAVFSRMNDIEEISPTVELVDGKWVLIRADEVVVQKKDSPNTASKIVPFDEESSTIPEKVVKLAFNQKVSSPTASFELQSFDGDPSVSNSLQVDDTGAFKTTPFQRRPSRQRSKFELGFF